MANGMDLLRLLEPAVRPGGLPGPVTAPREPIESRSFDSILEEAKSLAASNDGEGGRATEDGDAMADIAAKGDRPAQGVNAMSADPLAALSRVDLIDNAALLKIIGNLPTAH